VELRIAAAVISVADGTTLLVMPPASVRLIPLRFIKRAQSLGFTLDEILGLLALDEKTACLETRQIAADKLALINEKLADLMRLKKALSSLVHACDESSANGSCPIIHLLVQD
jgi:MerR family mercuric resistance operon transcriptional regulator